MLTLQKCLHYNVLILEVQPSDAEIAEDCGGFEAFRVAACAKVVLTSVTRKPGQKLKYNNFQQKQ